MPRFKVEATNFRAMDHLCWSPEGVCLLVGPNGAGKTTVLDILLFVRNLFAGGIESAFNAVDALHLRRLGSPADAPVTLQITVDDLQWSLKLPMTPHGLSTTFGEEIVRGGKSVVSVPIGVGHWTYAGQSMPLDWSKRTCARVLFDRGETWLKPLADALDGIRVYKPYDLDEIRRSVVTSSHESILHGAGRNLWAVLANWKGSEIRSGNRYDWLMEKAREAFPGIVHAIDFDRGLPFLYRPGFTDPTHGLPPGRAPDGLLTGLCHLTAIAGTPNGGIVAIDEMENFLHPHAIRRLLAAMNSEARRRDITVIITTHSPVLMNAFRRQPEQYFILDAASSEAQPIPLSELHDEDWLAQVPPGELYDRLEIASPFPSAQDA